MSNYTKTVDFAAKDTLPSGDSGKIIKGTEFETEFDNIATAVATKADSAAPTFTGTSVFTNLDINGTVQADGAVTVGVDDTGYDVKFFGATTGKSLLWDESADSLIVTGTTTLVGTTNLDAVDVDGDMTFGDNNKAIFGAGSDLEIYSDGSKSIIKESGPGSLVFQATNINFKDATDTDLTARFITGGDVQLYYDGSEKLATTSTGIDVTGSVTADGLTVEATTPSVILSETDRTDENTQLLNASGDFRIRTRSDDGGINTDRLRIDHGTGDISFYSSDGLSQALFWDASAESLGIGTSSPDHILCLEDAEPTLRIFDSANTLDQEQTIAFGTEPGDRTHAEIAGINTNTGNAAGALSFKTNAGSSVTERMRIDSSGNVGIGGTPTAPLHVFGGGILGASSTNPIAFTGSGGTNAGIGSYTANSDFNVYSAGTGDIKFVTGAVWSSAGVLTTVGSERMRIDSSGNLLVGTTDTDPSDNSTNSTADDGVAITAVGEVRSSRYLAIANSGAVGFFNRTGTDGDIVRLRKSGTTVGSIGTESGRVFMYGNSTYPSGIRLGNNVLEPSNSSGTARDALTSLGGSSSRFKDLYLSGGVYLGGTGAANKLEDYEEGTFTPEIADAVTGGNTATGSTVEGHYTKVGRLVTLNMSLINIDTTGMTGGLDLFIRALPFTSAGGQTGRGEGSVRADQLTYSGYVTPAIEIADAYLRLADNVSATSDDLAKCFSNKQREHRFVY